MPRIGGVRTAGPCWRSPSSLPTLETVARVTLSEAPVTGVLDVAGVLDWPVEASSIDHASRRPRKRFSSSPLGRHQAGSGRASMRSARRVACERSTFSKRDLSLLSGGGRSGFGSRVRATFKGETKKEPAF